MTHRNSPAVSLTTLMLIAFATFAAPAVAQDTRVENPEAAATRVAEVDTPRDDDASADHDAEDPAVRPAAENVAPEASDGAPDDSGCAPCEPVGQRNLMPSDAQILRLAREIRERERAELRAELAPARVRRRRTRRISLSILGVLVAGAITGAAIAVSHQTAQPPRSPSPGSSVNWCIACE